MAQPVPGIHTRTEILSQPQVWKECLDHLAAALPDLPRLSGYDQIVFTGCGSTYYLSWWAARQCQARTGLPSIALPASEMLLFPSAWVNTQRRSLLVSVSRSARTTETIRAVEAFRTGRVGDVLSVTCYPNGPLARLSDWVLGVPAAQEQSVAQTRSFTSMVIALIWWLVGQPLPPPSTDMGVSGELLINRFHSLAEDIGQDQRLQRFFVLGSGPRYGMACEAMLKLKEMSLSYAEAFHFMELRHGPMSLVSAESLVMGLVGAEAPDHELRVLQEMRSLGATTLAVVIGADGTPPAAVDRLISIPTELEPVWHTPLYLPVLQLIGYHRAMRQGLDPDRPAHLQAVVVLDE